MYPIVPKQMDFASVQCLEKLYLKLCGLHEETYALTNLCSAYMEISLNFIIVHYTSACDLIGDGFHRKIYM